MLSRPHGDSTPCALIIVLPFLLFISATSANLPLAFPVSFTLLHSETWDAQRAEVRAGAGKGCTVNRGLGWYILVLRFGQKHGAWTWTAGPEGFGSRQPKANNADNVDRQTCQHPVHWLNGKKPGRQSTVSAVHWFVIKLQHGSRFAEDAAQ
ncbi:hypothetical protein V6N12_043454 [Hibiscus sabdariffa]|uniref:Secreted protein n=1 Tax=Hibiscus sabdariffa TaxID=183260 RepID=A0ABR2DED0_9ROSI